MKNWKHHIKKLKITIFVTYTYPYIGSGIGNVAITQAEKLAELGNDVTVVSSNYPKTKPEFTKNKVHHIKLSALYFLEKLHIPVPLFIFNSKVINSIRKSDIVHVHDSVYPSSFFATLFSWLYKKPIIITQHIGYIDYSNFAINLLQKMAYGTIAKLSFLLSNNIIFINEKIEKQFNLNNKKKSVIVNGVDTAFFHPVSKLLKQKLRKKHNLPIKKGIVLFVGRFVPKKGYRLLTNIHSNRFLILLVGDEKNNNIIDHNSLKSLGKKNQIELREIYQLSDIFVLPSTGEGLPLSIQEAMACGLPIVTVKNPGYDKYFAGDFIKYVKPNTNDIKKTCNALVKNKKLLIKMGKDAREYVCKEYSWDKNIESTINIYRRFTK